MLRTCADSFLLVAALLAGYGCGGAVKQVPYYAECHCDCAAELRPCATRGMIDCDLDGQASRYEEFFKASCKDYEVAKGYFNCALIDVGQPGEPSSKVTSLNPVDIEYCAAAP